MTCEYCESAGGEVLWENALARVVLVSESGFPGFCRVICQRHVREMTDLPPAERAALMDIVFASEEAIREVLSPFKVNLASLGNQTPHVHWHVIPRYADDTHFPSPIWAAARRGALERNWPTDWQDHLRQSLARHAAGR
jgi:diadenosine tetraphosphate (Ap4A) HIT family hydrolase